MFTFHVRLVHSVHSVCMCVCVCYKPLSYCELCDECSVDMHSDWFQYLVLTSPQQMLKWPYLPHLRGVEMQFVLLSRA